MGSLVITNPALPMFWREKDQHGLSWRMKAALSLGSGQIWPTKDSKALVNLLYKSRFLGASDRYQIQASLSWKRSKYTGLSNWGARSRLESWLESGIYVTRTLSLLCSPLCVRLVPSHYSQASYIQPGFYDPSSARLAEKASSLNVY